MDRPPSPNPVVTTPVSTLTPAPSEQTLYAQANLARAIAKTLGNSPSQRASARMTGDPQLTEAGMYQTTFIEARRP